MVKDIWPSLGGCSGGALVNIGGTLFFHAQSSYAAGLQPWTSDGTAAGTVQLASLYPGNTSQAGSFCEMNGTVYFTAADGTHGVELWAVAGAAAGVGPVDRDPDGSVSLLPCEPNPVRTSAGIAYTLATAGRVTLAVYDAQGRVVRTLVDGEQAAGAHRAEFDARGLANGVYFYRLRNGSHVRERKLALQR